MGIGHRTSIDVFGQVASREAIDAEVGRRLTSFPHLPYVEVVKQAIGPSMTVHDRPHGRESLAASTNPSYERHRARGNSTSPFLDAMGRRARPVFRAVALTILLVCAVPLVV